MYMLNDILSYSLQYNPQHGIYCMSAEININLEHFIYFKTKKNIYWYFYRAKCFISMLFASYKQKQ